VQRLRFGTAGDHCCRGDSRAQLDWGAVGGPLRSGLLGEQFIGDRAIGKRAIRDPAVCRQHALRGIVFWGLGRRQRRQ